MSDNKHINVVVGKDCRIDPDSDLENVLCGDNVVINSGAQLKNVVVGNNSKVSRHVTLYALSPEAPVLVGKNVWFGPGVFGEATGGTLKFGDHTGIGHFSTFLTSSGPGEKSMILNELYPTELGPIIVGDYCWLGAHSLFLPGVDLAEGVTIGSNSVVRNIIYKPWSLYAGSPAVYKRTFDMNKVNELKKKYGLD